MIRKTIKSTNREHYACSRLVPQVQNTLITENKKGSQNLILRSFLFIKLNGNNLVKVSLHFTPFW